MQIITQKQVRLCFWKSEPSSSAKCKSSSNPPKYCLSDHHTLVHPCCPSSTQRQEVSKRTLKSQRKKSNAIELQDRLSLRSSRRLKSSTHIRKKQERCTSHAIRSCSKLTWCKIYQMYRVRSSTLMRAGSVARILRKIYRLACSKSVAHSVYLLEHRAMRMASLICWTKRRWIRARNSKRKQASSSQSFLNISQSPSAY